MPDDAIQQAEAVAQAFAFPRLQEVDNMSPEQISKTGFAPPFHGRCRCDMVFLWRTATKTPMEQIPYQDMQIHYGNIDTMGPQFLSGIESQIQDWHLPTALPAQKAAYKAFHGAVKNKNLGHQLAISVNANTGEVIAIAHLEEWAYTLNVRTIGAAGNVTGGAEKLFRALAVQSMKKKKAFRVLATDVSAPYYQKLGMIQKEGTMWFKFTKKQLPDYIGGDPDVKKAKMFVYGKGGAPGTGVKVTPTAAPPPQEPGVIPDGAKITNKKLYGNKGPLYEAMEGWEDLPKTDGRYLCYEAIKNASKTDRVLVLWSPDKTQILGVAVGNIKGDMFVLDHLYSSGLAKGARKQLLHTAGKYAGKNTRGLLVKDPLGLHNQIFQEAIMIDAGEGSYYWTIAQAKHVGKFKQLDLALEKMPGAEIIQATPTVKIPDTALATNKILYGNKGPIYQGMEGWDILPPTDPKRQAYNLIANAKKKDRVVVIWSPDQKTIYGVAKIRLGQYNVYIDEMISTGTHQGTRQRIMLETAKFAKKKGMSIHLVDKTGDLADFAKSLNMIQSSGKQGWRWSIGATEKAATAKTVDDMVAIATGKAVPPPTPPPKTPPTKKPPATQVTQKPEPKPAPPPEASAGWEEIPNTQLGSNPGGQFIDAHGQKWYVKFYEDPNQLRSEYAAIRLGAVQGVGVADVQLVEITWQGQKRLGIASKWLQDGEAVKGFIDKLAKMKAAELDQIAKQYLHASLVANWDVVGAEFDNLVKFGDKWLCIDFGGSFAFRAKGLPKEFKGIVTEMESFLISGRRAAKVFDPVVKKTIYKNPAKYIKWLEGLDDANIEKVLAQAGFEGTELTNLVATLKARREYMLTEMRELMDLKTAKVKEVRRRIFDTKAPYKSAEHNKLYKKVFAEYENMTVDEIRESLRKNCPTVLDYCDRWQGSAQSTKAYAIRRWIFLNEKAEMGWMMKNRELKAVEELMAKIPDEEMIRVRAATQAYLKKRKKKTIKMYRGIGGNSGTDYQKKAMRRKKANPKDWEDVVMKVNDWTISGWSSRESVASGFGNRFYLIDIEKPAEEVFFLSELWPKHGYLSEHETLCFGFFDQLWKLRDMGNI
jgi:hypothetical protein